MYVSLDDVDVDLMWQVSLPFSVWWICSLIAVAIRLSHRNFDFSLAGIRAHVAITEIDSERRKNLVSTKSATSIYLKSSFSLFENVDYFVFKMMQCFGFSMSAVLFCFKRNRDQREHRRTSMELGEIALQIQPLFVMFLWGIIVLTIQGGVLFGLLLLFVGQPMTGLLWLLLAWEEAGWSRQNLVNT